MMARSSTAPLARPARIRSKLSAAMLVAALAAPAVLGMPARTVLANSGSSFKTTAGPGGGTIVTGTLGDAQLPAATATLLRAVHAKLGARPTVVQIAQNAREHSLALLFTATHDGKPYTGLAIVSAPPGAEAGGAALYDLAGRFPSSVGSMMRRLRTITTPSTTTASAHAALDPAEPLGTRPFSDGTGSIGIPADWTIGGAGGGSAIVAGPGRFPQVSYNMHLSAMDPSSPRARMAMQTLAFKAMHTVVLPYTSDPVDAWVNIYSAHARAAGFTPEIHVSSKTPLGSAYKIAGTLGSGAKLLNFLAYVFVLPPDPNGGWSISDTHIFIKPSEVVTQGATAVAVLNSVHIDFNAVAGQETAIRQMFARQFATDIANDQAQDAQRKIGTDEALASDRDAQEGMHRQAVSMENYSLDRAVVVNTRTGEHSTIDSDFADDLTASNPNYQKVPTRDLLRGVDY